MDKVTLTHLIRDYTEPLFTVARNLVIDHKRMRMARVIEVRDAELITVADPRDPIGECLHAHAIWRAVARLTPHHQAVLVQVYRYDRSVTDAAKRLGIPIGTLKSRTHHALRSLRTMLDEPRPTVLPVHRPVRRAGRPQTG